MLLAFNAPLRRRSKVRPPGAWNVMVDMFFYRDPEEVEKQQQEEAQSKALPAEAAEEPVGLPDWDASVPQAGPVAALDSG